MSNDNREQWLNDALDMIETTIFAPAIAKTKLTVEQTKVAISIGHPKGGRKVIGQCWATRASEDRETNQIFITPHENDSVRVLDVLVHERVHAYDDCKSGHRGRFATLARAVGLEGKLTATHAGQELRAKLENIIAALGDIPHVKLDQARAPIKKQAARMIKIECNECGFLFRASRTQIERLDRDAPCPCCARFGHLKID